jgi:predicted O-methyltransferase YrrM
MELTQNWFKQNIPIWTHVLKGLTGKPIKAIEIGSFEGESTVWLCENILTHKDSHLDSVDPYLPYLDPQFGLNQRTMDLIEERFYKNTEPFKDKITTHKMSSFDYLKSRTELADLIYVDGDHSAKACLIDMVQSHLILSPGGIMITDDYLWAGLFEGLDVPKGAVNYFTSAFAEEYKLISIGYQVILQKNMVK